MPAPPPLSEPATVNATGIFFCRCTPQVYWQRDAAHAFQSLMGTIRCARATHCAGSVVRRCLVGSGCEAACGHEFSSALLLGGERRRRTGECGKPFTVTR